MEQIKKLLIYLILPFVLGLGIKWLITNTGIKTSGRYIVVNIKYISDADSIRQAKKNQSMDILIKIENTDPPALSDAEFNIVKDKILKDNNITEKEHKVYAVRKKIIYHTKRLKELNKQLLKADDIEKRDLNYRIVLEEFYLSNQKATEFTYLNYY